MLGLVIGELSLLALMWVAFVLVHGRGHWWRLAGGRPNWVGRQLMAVGVVGLAEAVGLILLGTGHALPLWAYAVGFGAADVVMCGWLLLLWRARHLSDQRARRRVAADETS
jgi:hypothetical protein